jgi:uncharacterized protein (TIGR03437 family)
MCFWFSVLAAVPLAAQVSVLTYQYDNSRAGANLQETALSPANVNPGQFGKLFSYPVDGYVYGQPLLVPDVNVPGKGVHNVVFVVTEHDSVYAFDADSNTGPNAAPLWHDSFINAAAGVTTVPSQDTGCDQIVPEIGITSTPVIDPQSGNLYVVAMTKEAAAGGTAYVHRLHALDLASGAEKSVSPVVIQATYQGSGEGGSTLVFNARNYKQRPGLLLLNGIVYTAWSSHCDLGPYHGWIIGYDAQTLRQVSVYNSTPNGNEGSFWAGGAAPAADAAGNIYVVTGNGSFDYASGGPDLGESYIKLSTTGGLGVAGYFTPFNYQPLNDSDTDTGSAGVALLPDDAGSSAHPHLMVGAGKEGRIYLLDRDQPGALQAGSDMQIVESIPGVINSVFGNPAYFNHTIYFCAANDQMKAFPISQAHMATSEASRSDVQFGFPGCVPTVSANGTGTAGIVWAIDPAGVLRAYDAANLAREIYNSSANTARDALGAAVKFSVPAVANGKIYAGTQTSLVVYGLLGGGGAVPAAANAASGDRSALAPGSIVSIYGQSLAQSTASAGTFPLPNVLGGATVTVNGAPVPLLYASAAQINFQMPFGIAPGAAQVAVTVNGAAAGSTTVNVQPVAPGIFLLDSDRAAALNPDNSINSADNAAAAGSPLMLFATGLGAVAPSVTAGTQTPDAPLSQTAATVTASIGGQPATVLFAGLAPGFAGLYQVNVCGPGAACRRLSRADFRRRGGQQRRHHQHSLSATAGRARLVRLSRRQAPDAAGRPAPRAR